MKNTIMALILLAVTAFANAYAQAHVNSGDELNIAIENAVSGDAISVTQDIVMDADIVAVNDLDVSIGSGGAQDYFLSGNNEYSGFRIKNSTVSINGLNLTGFKVDVSTSVNFDGSNMRNYGSALYADGSVISYTGNSIILSNNTSLFSMHSTTDATWAAYSCGGAISSSFSDFTFDSAGDIVFSSNTAFGAGYAHDIGSVDGVGRGGAVYSENSVFTFSSLGDIVFSNNSALGSGTTYENGLGDGGAIYSQYSNFSFDASGNIIFSNNEAAHGGAIFSLYNYSGVGFVFNSSKDIIFSNNKSFSAGGAIASSVSSYYSPGFIFNSLGNIIFSNNEARSFLELESGETFRGVGGALNFESSTFSLNSSGDIIFSNNTAFGFAGAIYSGYNVYSAYNTSSFNSLGNIIFSNNSALGGGGGAIYTFDTALDFKSLGNIVFSNNTASGSGGAIYSSGYNIFTFESSGDIIFSNNTASYGGGAINSWYTSSSFDASGDIIFSNNVSHGDSDEYDYIAGGAICGYYGDLTFNSLGNIIFSNNAIYGNGNGFSAGGAIYLRGTPYYPLPVLFNSLGDITFSNNSAFATDLGAGGAMYVQGSELTFQAPSLKFENNIANGFGGAFYITDGSIVNFDAVNSDMNILFKDNYANGRLNDAYLTEKYYEATDYDDDWNYAPHVAAYYGDPSVLNFNAAGGNIILSNGIRVDGDGSGTVNKTGGASLIFGGETVIENAAFNITGGDVIFLDNASFTGTSMALPGTTLDMHNATANTITAETFASTGNTKMDIFAGGAGDQVKSVTADIDGNIAIYAGLGKYDNAEYDLIITENSLTGKFAGSSINRGDFTYELRYEDGIVKLIVNGVYTANFGALSRLTYNQTQTAKAFEKISENPGKWEQTLIGMIEKQESGTDDDIAAVKDFLSGTSGYFLTNVIRNLAADSPNNEVYDKIRRQSEEWRVKIGDTATYNGSGLWIQAKGGIESFKKDENSPEDYKDLSYGVMFGFDRFLADSDLMWGVYGRINKDNIEQGKNKADGNKNGVGLYGGYLKDNWELKAMALGSYDMFSTERAAYSGAIAKADINAVTVSADFEAALKIWLNDDMNFRTFAGVEAANAMYGGFKESGAGIYNLDTRSGNYLRTAGRLGAGLDYKKGRWVWYANVEGKYLIDGTKPEITSQFEGTGIDFNSRGAEEGKIQAGAGVGGEVRISDNWKGFANAKYYAAERYENVTGNIGVRYMFGKKQNKAAQKASIPEMNSYAEEAETAARAAEAAGIAQEARLEKERVKQEEAQRIAEEARITKEISDEDMAKQKKEAQERRKRPMLKTYTLTTHFRTNEYFLTDEFKEQLKEIAQELKEYEYKTITIEGHTDSTGTKEINKKLSRQRARSVYDEFAKNGVDKTKLTYEGFAAELPVESNETAEGRAANRRTEIFVE